MKVLVDTSVWSIALRRKENNEITRQLTGLILDSLVVMIGPVRQELLSGISDRTLYDDLKEKLKSYADIPVITRDYETAAEFYNTCRVKGIQGSHVDFLICATAYNNELMIFTVDKDFERYAGCIPIRLLK